MAINNLFTNTFAAATAKQEAKARRCPVVLQVWCNTKKAKQTEEGVAYITLRANILEFNPEKGEALGLAKGERIQVRFFEETEKNMVCPEGIADPLDAKARCFYAAGWLEFDAKPWVRTYEKVDEETGEVTEGQVVTKTAKIRGLAFGRSVNEAVTLMDALVEEFKARKQERIEAAKAKREAVQA